MAYGRTLEEVDTRKFVQKEETDYGAMAEIISEPEFLLKKFFIIKDKNLSLKSEKEHVLFVEEGKIRFNGQNLTSSSVILVPENTSLLLNAQEDSTIYYFAGSNGKINELVITTTSDVRDKYWGKIETIFSNEIFAAKRIELLPEKPGSLEYHLHKKEAYFVHAGKVRVGVRVGRAENKSLNLEPSQAFLINQGTMHCRYGTEPSVIIEISTKDDDADSHLVEDGSKGYMHL